MNKKSREEKVGSLTLTVVISAITTILGIVMGYFGTRANAQAQIEAARINIYGPISATQTAEVSKVSINAMTPETDGLALEKTPQQVLAYSGNSEKTGGFATMRVIYSGADAYPYYTLDYNLPEGQNGYAGIAFQFDNGQNVAEYKAIEFTIQFAGTNVAIDFFVRDISGRKNAIRIVSMGTEQMKLQYELDNFKDIDFHALREVGFNSDNTFSSGEHTVTIHAIRFVH